MTLGSWAVAGGINQFSDLDFVVICRAEDQTSLMAEARQVARRAGPLLACFTGEHVGEPRLTAEGC
ncbi:MAG TPA: hypothetical protein VKF14_21355 [Candidatus Dormibacteraeota bacterium]|nr:hypothetical protein [Candidatus Dormibacteraeota bacterium]